MRPTDFCTSKLFESNTRVFVDSQRSDPWVPAGFGRVRGNRSRAEARASCPSVRRLPHTACIRPETSGAGTGWLGASQGKDEAGG